MPPVPAAHTWAGRRGALTKTPHLGQGLQGGRTGSPFHRRPCPDATAWHCHLVPPNPRAGVHGAGDNGPGSPIVSGARGTGPSPAQAAGEIPGEKEGWWCQAVGAEPRAHAKVPTL